MKEISFEWDEGKNKINQAKHHIAFEEAVTVFQDVNAIVIRDDNHSDEEERFIILGISAMARLLVVVHCYRDENAVIRLISARKATRTEANQYVGGI